MNSTTVARNASLNDVAAILKQQHSRKVDVVAHAASITAVEGNILLQGTEPVLTPDGVDMQDGLYRPTPIFDEGIADKLGIPLSYVRRMREKRPDLYDLNVNGWLRDSNEGRKFLLRAFQAGDGGIGVARAMLSQNYKSIDNLDVLVAVLNGIKASMQDVNFVGMDLSERKMRVRVQAPEVMALAPTLLKGYRSPFDNADPGTQERMRRHGYIDPGDEPVVFAGFEFSNSETGCGAFSIVPRLIVKVCTNGLTITKDALRAVHLGGKLEEGVIKWSGDTQRKNLELITSKTVDAVTTYLDVEYVESVVAALEEKAEAPLTNPADDIKIISKKMLYTEEQANGILDHFIKGGQVNAAGVLQAVTSFAQTIHDADVAADMEASAIKAFDMAAAMA